MATAGEKIVGGVLGAGLGYLVSSSLVNDNPNLSQGQKDGWNIFGVILGAFAGVGVANLVGTNFDTVNYTYYNKGERVYDGITYEHRVDIRPAEHRAQGKVFDRIVMDQAKPRQAAIKLETNRIKRFRPKYNIQHNN